MRHMIRATADRVPGPRIYDIGHQGVCTGMPGCRRKAAATR
jgi:hypothetical protein